VLISGKAIENLAKACFRDARLAFFVKWAKENWQLPGTWIDWNGCWPARSISRLERIFTIKNERET
jgi:hypothetical protein